MKLQDKTNAYSKINTDVLALDGPDSDSPFIPTLVDYEEGFTHRAVDGGELIENLTKDAKKWFYNRKASLTSRWNIIALSIEILLTVAIIMIYIYIKEDSDTFTCMAFSNFEQNNTLCKYASIFTYSLLHEDIEHALDNVSSGFVLYVFLFLLGPALKPYFLVVLHIASAAAGSLTTFIIKGNAVIGYSGVVFGLSFAFIVSSIYKFSILAKKYRILSDYWRYFSAICLLIAAGCASFFLILLDCGKSKRISCGVHFGGFIVGFLFGLDEWLRLFCLIIYNLIVVCVSEFREKKLKKKNIKCAINV